MFLGRLWPDILSFVDNGGDDEKRQLVWEGLNSGKSLSLFAKAEASIRGRPPDERQQVRASRGRAVVEALRQWLGFQLGRLAGRSRLAEAIRYALSRWTALTRFLNDGRIELDTNPVERAIRPVALGRKNALFAGSEGGAGRWAIVASLIETAKLNGVAPFAWLRDALTRMLEGHPVQAIDALMPWSADVRS